MTKLPDDLGDEETRFLARHFVGNAEEVRPDSQGRILVPSWQYELAGISGEVVMVGMGNRIEMWSVDLHGKSMQQHYENFKRFGEKIFKRSTPAGNPADQVVVPASS
ncbi:MAG: division/cell wall cluster transcriptional repressor MraZ [Planctomycetes bacterium]|nr:division/cell wall cluster transcriptional repressor MraZ [Planctomycetota bacterium]